jgi:hypothetical protein
MLYLIMKTLNLSLLFTILGIVCSAITHAQDSGNALISQNVIKTSSGLQVKNIKSIDLSKYGTSDQEKIQALLNALKTNSDNNTPQVFTCDNAQATKPRQLKDLNAIDDRAYEVTRNTGLNLTLWGISGSLNKRDILIQANFWAYKDCDCSNGTSTRALVGMVLYLHIKDLNIKVNSLSLPNISAAVQLGKASADYHLQMFGVTEAIDFADLPSLGDLSVENYSKITNAWDKIKRSLKTDAKIDPVIVSNILRSNPITI